MYRVVLKLLAGGGFGVAVVVAGVAATTVIRNWPGGVPQQPALAEWLWPGSTPAEWLWMALVVGLPALLIGGTAATLLYADREAFGERA